MNMKLILKNLQGILNRPNMADYDDDVYVMTCNEIKITSKYIKIV